MRFGEYTYNQELELLFREGLWQMRAYVYIAKNKAFPGLLKIGLAKNVPSRIASLSNPSVPFKFELVESFLFEDAAWGERRTHELLGSFRVAEDREFFKCSEAQAIKTVRGAILEEQKLGAGRDHFHNLEKPTPLPRDVDRLIIEMEDLYQVWVEARRMVYSGRLRWRTINETDYLLRIPPKKTNGKSLGARTPELERMFEESQEAEARQEATWERLLLKGRMLKAASIPMTTPSAGEILRALDAAGLLGSHLMVVGTAAIPAYEIAAGVHADNRLRNTSKLKVLWVGTETRLSFVETVLVALKHTDSTWTVNQERPFQLRNRHGDLLDVLVAPSVSATFPKREAIRAVATEGQEDLLGGQPLERVVLDSAGLPARVVAPDPRLFALHKLRLAAVPERRVEKRGKDRLQALAVLDWVREHMPEYPLDEGFAQGLSLPLAQAWQAYQQERLAEKAEAVLTSPVRKTPKA
jgi:hypothetical protein